MLSLNWPEMEVLTVPQVFKIGGYLVYFWVNENDLLEPVHVHIAEGKPVKRNEDLADKGWRLYFAEQ